MGVMLFPRKNARNLEWFRLWQVFFPKTLRIFFWTFLFSIFSIFSAFSIFSIFHFFYFFYFFCFFCFFIFFWEKITRKFYFYPREEAREKERKGNGAINPLRSERPPRWCLIALGPKWRSRFFSEKENDNQKLFNSNLIFFLRNFFW